MQNITLNNINYYSQSERSEVPPSEGSREAALSVIECPRDAMQGWSHFIPTEKKIKYINALLKCGFHTLDVGSFVSPKAIPQMADTQEVIRNLELGSCNTKLLVIIANERGAEAAVAFDQISYLGFPFSISETFQQRNTNSSINESLKRVEAIQELCLKNKKELVVYISMGFGNPYGDEYNNEIVLARTKQIADVGVKIISIADTVGLATAEEVGSLMNTINPQFSDIEIGVHLHSAPHNREQKLAAAIAAGCKRFDAAIKGIGGCPMAGNDLVGNMDTEVMINYFEKNDYQLNINKTALAECNIIADEIFV
ncbi:MAG: hydroxymethylglutaryl-CoA lyase [Ferruginibacter sp.]|nr:hydroxymethylglutaryl-CoA lyase [Ferruginibacter sp.]